MDSLIHLQSEINYYFRNQELLIQALTHRSCAKVNNERLEFLGDAVLDLVVGEYLFDKFTSYNEGQLSKMRSCLVNEKSFANLARILKIGDSLILSANEAHNHGREKDSLISNAFEAVMGALYLEAGIQKVKEVMYYLLDTYYPNMESKTMLTDYKTALQEITQAKFGEIPIYELIEESGPDHNKQFLMQIIINKKVYALANGTSKKAAQQACAKIAYKKILQQTDGK